MCTSMRALRPVDKVDPKIGEEKARAQWNEALGRIAMEGGTPAQRRVFYTSLYRCMERMINTTEDGRYYSGYDHEVHEDARPFCVDHWLWDTYRAMEPLQTLLNPDTQTILPWKLGPKTVLDDFHSAHGYMPALRPGEKETVAEVASFETR